MKSIMMVFCVDDGYFHLLEENLRSLQSILDQFDIGIIDIGLSSSNKSRVHSYSKRVTFVEPGWKIEFPDNNKSPKHKQGMLARPFIAEMFPGYSGYFYADADVWFADPSAVIDYIEAARATGASFGIEAHPTYEIHQTLRSIHFKKWILIYGYKSHLFSNVLKMFGPDIAIKMANHSLLNSGIFYMDANSPIWNAWIQYIRRAKVTVNNISNQACLHVAIVEEALPFAAMPATHNWLPAKSPPAIDLKSLSLVEPCFPNAPIKAIHLTDKSERREFELMTIDGGERVRTHLTRSAFLQWQSDRSSQQ